MKRVKKFIDGIAKKYLDDILLVVGIALLFWGVFLIYRPAGIIVLGICFVVLAYLAAKRAKG